jgi:hypothetical protein
VSSNPAADEVFDEVVAILECVREHLPREALHPSLSVRQAFSHAEGLDDWREAFEALQSASGDETEAARARFLAVDEAMPRWDSLSRLLAQWFLDRCPGATGEERVDAALTWARAAKTSPDPEAGEFRTLLGCARDGSITGMAFVRRLDKYDAIPRAEMATSQGTADHTQAEAILMNHLVEAGVDRTSPDPTAVWRAYRDFATTVEFTGGAPFVLASDDFLFQWGAYDWHDGRGERFEVDFTRQFVLHEADGTYHHMEQLNCTLLYAPTGELRALGNNNLWSGTPEGWIEEVEATDALRAAMTSAPVELRIRQSDI